MEGRSHWQSIHKMPGAETDHFYAVVLLNGSMSPAYKYAVKHLKV